MRKVYAQADYIAVNVSSRTPRACGNCRTRGLEGVLARSSRHAKGSAGSTPNGCLCWSRSLRTWNRGKSPRSRPLCARSESTASSPQYTTDLSALGPGWPDDRRGGLSGAPLHARSLAVVEQLRAELGSGFPIIGVGGIVDADRALATLRAGANLLQIYTGSPIGAMRSSRTCSMRSAGSRTAPRPRPDDGFMIGEDLIEQFQRDGAVRIPRLFTPSDMASSRRAST